MVVLNTRLTAERDEAHAERRKERQRVERLTVALRAMVEGWRVTTPADEFLKTYKAARALLTETEKT